MTLVELTDEVTLADLRLNEIMNRRRDITNFTTLHHAENARLLL